MPARDTNETIIRLDHDEKYAEIWTSDGAVRRKLQRGRAAAAGKQRGAELLRVPLDRFAWRILGGLGAKPRTAAQIAATAKLMEARNAAKSDPA